MASITPAPNTLKPTKPEQGADPEQEGSRPAGSGHVGEGVTGKGLAPHDGEHPDDRRTQRRWQRR